MTVDGTKHLRAAAALNGIEMNEVILDKDNAASVKYHHRLNLEQFIAEKRNHRNR